MISEQIVRVSNTPCLLLRGRSGVRIPFGVPRNVESLYCRAFGVSFLLLIVLGRLLESVLLFDIDLVQPQAGFDACIFVDRCDMPLAGAAGEVQGVSDFLNAFF